jgi:hypothetical protein
MTEHLGLSVSRLPKPLPVIVLPNVHLHYDGRDQGRRCECGYDKAMVESQDESGRALGWTCPGCRKWEPTD